VVSLIEVLIADGALLQTLDAQAQARTEVARAAITSFRALGGGWDVPSGPDSSSTVVSAH
jgi:outer membrane protein TolC